MRSLISTQSSFPDPTTWDVLVASDPHGHLLQTWAWGELKAAFGWTPVRLAVEQDGALIAGAQVLYRRLGPLTLAYIPKGPVLPSTEQAASEALWAAIHSLSRKMRAVSLKVEPEWRDAEPDRHTWLATQGLHASEQTIQPRRTIIVDLRGTEDELLARMKSKWRYNIRLSERKGVVVRSAGAEGIDTFHALMRLTGERDSFGIHSAAYYQRAYTLFAPLGRVQLLMAESEGEPLAGLMAYAFNGQAWYMYGASSNAQREKMPNHQLQWRAMQWAREQGCTQYDLWGIPDADGDPEADLAGVGRFKAGFGGEVVRYVGACDYTYLPMVDAILQRVWRTRARRALNTS